MTRTVASFRPRPSRISESRASGPCGQAADVSGAVTRPDLTRPASRMIIPCQISACGCDARNAAAAISTRWQIGRKATGIAIIAARTSVHQAAKPFNEIHFPTARRSDLRSCGGPRVYEGSFERLVVIEQPGRVGQYRRVGSVREAAECLIDQWPKNRGVAYLAALHACLDAVRGSVSTETARQAFIAAAREVGILIGEAPLRG